MKKQLSVFALHARAAIGRLALVLLGTLALDAAAYALFGLRMYPPSLTGSALVTALRVIFSLGLVACQLLLASCFGAGSRYGYTQRRLQIPLPLAALCAGAAGYLLGEALQSDYFGPGVLTVLVFALCRQWHIGRLPELAAMLVINGWLLPSADMTLWGVTLPVELLATAALLPIWLYRGRQGPHSPVLQGIWYAFYPAHLLLLWWLARSIGI